MEKKELLEIRKKSKARKPDFIRQDTHKKSRLKVKWIKPRGWQSKIRLHRKGYRKSVSPGYGSPRKVAGLHSSGLEMIRISTIKELDNINKEEQGIIISRTLGLKKKLEVIKKSKEKGITILNIKNPEDFIKNKEEMLAKKKETKTKRLAAKEKKKKEAEKKADEKKDKAGLTEKISDEEKKVDEKKKKDKLLTKKE